MIDTILNKIKEKVRSFKKEDYIVMLLIGVLLVVISLPSENSTGGGLWGFGKESTEENAARDGAGAGDGIAEGDSVGNSSTGDGTDGREAGTEDANGETGNAGNSLESGTGNSLGRTEIYNAAFYDVDAYVEALEAKTAKLLSGMDGAGKVQVMITVADYGQEILEKDRESSTSDLEETDNAGGTRKSVEQQQSEEVIYMVDENGDKIPYVMQRKLPEITGVVVMAQGAGNNQTKDNLIEAVGVLFNLNEHKIKVIKMKS